MAGTPPPGLPLAGNSRQQFPALTTVWVGTGRIDDYGSAQIQSLFPDNEGRQPFRPESCLGEGIPFNPETGHQVPGYFVNGDGRR
jgi:hypothetical protein